MSRFTALLFTVLLALLGACGGGMGDETDPTPPSPTPPINLPLENQEADTWQNYAGAQDTVCASGAPYSHYAYKGSVNKLVIDFQGGGACWDAETCRQSSSNVGSNFTYLDTVNFYDVDGELPGIYDHAREDNPVQDWYHVYIPYCTGDIHIGNNTQTYTDDEGSFEIQHNGAVNAQSVLDWTFTNFEAPEQIFVTGCSAGGYGAAYWTQTIAEQYPNADIKQLGDCAAGVSDEAFASELATNWDTAATFPELTFDADVVDEAYTQALAAYPELEMAQYHSILDGVQIGFYARGTGQALSPEIGLEWSNIMRNSLNEIDATALNRFAYYISNLDENEDSSDGTDHCVIEKDDFYTLETNGVTFVDWLSDYLAGDEVENVSTTLTP